MNSPDTGVQDGPDFAPAQRQKQAPMQRLLLALGSAAVFGLPLISLVVPVTNWGEGVLPAQGAGIYWAALAAATLGIVSLFAFEGARRLAWVLICAVIFGAFWRAVHCEQQWVPTWRTESSRLRNATILQVCWLLWVPLQVLLWRAGGLTVSWARTALAAVAAIQIGTVLAQYAAFRLFGLDGLRILTDSGVLFARSSLSEFTEAPRLTGSTWSPTLLGVVMVMTWPALLPQGHEQQQPRGRKSMIRMAPLALVPFTIASSYSRAAYLGFAIQMACLVALRWQSCSRSGLGPFRRTGCVRALVAGLALACLALPRLDSRLAATFDLADASSAHRLRVWTEWLSFWIERPLSGWGPGFFDTLFNRFRRLPEVNYHYGNCHSAILAALFEYGAAGVALVTVALAGLPSRFALRRVPHFALLGVAGSVTPLLADNPTLDPVVCLPGVWLLGVWCVSSLSSQPATMQAASRPRGLSQRGVYFASITLFGLWFANFLVPMLPPQKRFERELTQVWRGALGEAGFYVKDLVSGRSWSHAAEREFQTQDLLPLALVVQLDKAPLSAKRTALPDSQRWDSGAFSNSQALPRPEREQLAWSALAHQYASWLAASDKQTSSWQAGPVGRRLHSWLQSLPGKAVTSDNAWAGEFALTPGEAAELLVEAKTACTTGCLLACRALEKDSAPWALTRFFQGTPGRKYHLAGDEPNRVGLMLFEAADERWIVCAMHASTSSIRGTVDHPAWLSMATLAYRVHLFLQPDRSGEALVGVNR